MIDRRQVAREFGLSRFTGYPCPHGHGSARYVSTGNCVVCQRAANERWKVENRDRYLAKLSEWGVRNRDATRERVRINRQADPEKYAERARRYLARMPQEQRQRYLDRQNAYNAANREKVREQTRRARKARPEVYKPLSVAAAANRRARKMNSDGTVSSSALRMLLADQGGRCAYCPATDDLHFDHKMPLSRGGKHSIENGQYLCRFHNLSKFTRTDEEYREILRLSGDGVELNLLLRSLGF